MAFIPTPLQPNTQVLWQPVIVQNLQNQNTERLRRQNQFLKRQLQIIMKINPSGPHIDKTFIQDHTNTDRFQSITNSYATLSRRPSENAYYSPRFPYHHHRPSQNQSPPLRSLFSPNRSSNLNQTQTQSSNEDHNVKRMVISKSKDGRYYRDRFQQMQQSYINEFSRTNLSKFATPQTSLRTTPYTTPNRTSDQLYDIQKSKIQDKPKINRMSSPNFLKSKHKNNKIQENVDIMKNLVEKLKESENHQTFKRSPMCDQKQSNNQYLQQSKIEYDYIKTQEGDRKQARLPTLDLSCQCDSALSIDRKLRQIKRQRKYKHSSNNDNFLQQIEQNLETLYGKQ